MEKQQLESEYLPLIIKEGKYEGQLSVSAKTEEILAWIEHHNNNGWVNFNISRKKPESIQEGKSTHYAKKYTPAQKSTEPGRSVTERQLDMQAPERIVKKGEPDLFEEQSSGLPF